MAVLPERVIYMAATRAKAREGAATMGLKGAALCYAMYDVISGWRSRLIIVEGPLTEEERDWVDASLSLRLVPGGKIVVMGDE